MLHNSPPTDEKEKKKPRMYIKPTNRENVYSRRKKNTVTI